MPTARAKLGRVFEPNGSSRPIIAIENWRNEFLLVIMFRDFPHDDLDVISVRKGSAYHQRLRLGSEVYIPEQMADKAFAMAADRDELSGFKDTFEELIQPHPAI